MRHHIVTTSSVEEKEFEHIVNRMRPLVTTLVTRFCDATSLEEDAEDLIQDVWVLLWNQRDKLEEVRNLEAWMTTLTKNLCVSRYRKRRQVHLLPITDYEFVNDHSAAYGVEEKENTQLMRDLLNSLPRNTRKILYLRNIKGMSLDEIATVTGRPKTSIKSSLTTAKHQVLTLLKQKK